jgi:hypothetical protein
LWDAIILRLLITILLSDIKLKLNTDQDPDVIEERVNAYTMLEVICGMDHKSVVDRLRAACGFY